MNETVTHPDGASSSGAATDKLGDLPEWNLGDLYPAPDSAELTRDLEWLAGECPAFARDYNGRLAQLSADEMFAAIERKEKIAEIEGRILTYAQLRHEQATTDSLRAKFLSDCQERINDLNTELVFFELEVNRLDEALLEARFASHAGLARYRRLFERIRAFRPHQLPDDMEKLLHDLGAVGDAWSRLYDETIAGLKFRISGKDTNIEHALNQLTDTDRSRREEAARELAKVLGSNVKLFARVQNTQVKEKEIIDRWRKFPDPRAARHLSNDVEPAVIDALRDAVVASYPRLTHRYYQLKREWLGGEKLEIWDRNAPLPMVDDRVIPWQDACGMVLDAYEAFDPRMGELARPFIDCGWIDAAVKPGKSQGAFSHPAVANVHPYIMLNYLGKTRDVMTLAHELGHGVHQRLAAGQGELLSRTPLTLAETASVFGEMLTFRTMLERTTDPGQRKALLAGKVEDMLNTVVRQIAFYDFECRLHDARRKGELTPEEIGDIWLDVQRTSLGPAFNFMEGYEFFWTYVLHFVHMPFYVYAYAFGDGLVSALYAVYRDHPQGFQDKYLDLLRAGGSRHYRELLAPFGLDPADKGFWENGLGVMAGMIEELEAMPC